MKPSELKERLAGVLAFNITPFKEDYSLDLDGLATLIDATSTSGVDAIVCTGGVGEFYALNAGEYKQVIRTTVEAACGRIPVIAGIGHTTAIACEMARFAEEVGADGLLINPPYFASPSLEGIYQHYQALGEVCSLGQIIFSTTQCAYPVEWVERLVDIPSVIGIKDEVGDIKSFVSMVERVGNRLAWINGMAEPLVPSYFASGATSFTTGIANFAPEIPIEIYHAARTGDFSTAQHLFSTKVSAIDRLRSKEKGYSIAVIKEAMAMLGLPSGPCRLPLTPLQPEDSKELRRILDSLELGGPAEHLNAREVR